MQEHILSVLVKNSSGVLNKITGLISRRGFNIDSLSVGVTEDKTVSRMTIKLVADEDIVKQAVKQLEKLYEVIKVKRLSKGTYLGREYCFIKIKATPETRTEINEIVEIFRAKVSDLSPESFIIETTGDADKLDALLEVLSPYGIIEIVRSGEMALERGSDPL